jgi:hypothetical protein
VHLWNCEERLSPASCLSAWNDSAPTWHLFMNFFFWKICWGKTTFIKFGQGYWLLYVNTNIHWSYLAHLLLEFELFHTKAVKKIKTHFIFSKFIFKKLCHWRHNVVKYSIAGQVTDGSMQRTAHIATNTPLEYVNFLLFYCNSCCINVLQCYMIYTVPACLPACLLVKIQ